VRAARRQPCFGCFSLAFVGMQSVGDWHACSPCILSTELGLPLALSLYVNMRPDSFVQLPAFYVAFTLLGQEAHCLLACGPAGAFVGFCGPFGGYCGASGTPTDFVPPSKSLTRVHTPCTRDLTWRVYSTYKQYCKRTPSVLVSTCDMCQIRYAFTLYGHTTSRLPRAGSSGRRHRGGGRALAAQGPAAQGYKPRLLMYCSSRAVKSSQLRPSSASGSTRGPHLQLTAA